MKAQSENRETARRLRENGLSLLEICQKTGCPKTTVFGWIKDLPVPVVDGLDIQTRARRMKKGNSCKERWRKRREEARNQGLSEAEDLLENKDIRDFICLYLAEGDKRSRYSVSIINTDPAIICLCEKAMKEFSARPIGYRLIGSQEEEVKLREFWAEILKIPSERIKYYCKKQVSKRRSEFGLMVVRTGDTYFKCRILAWMDKLKDSWAYGQTD